MGKRIILAAMLASLTASAGCLRERCERHGYYPVAPTGGTAANCCVPCCPPQAAGYVAPAAVPAWNAPAPPPAAGNCCCPPPPQAH